MSAALGEGSQGLLAVLPWVAAGGAIGAAARFLLVALLPGSAANAFSWGTLTVNVAGCLAIGALAAALAGSPWFDSFGRPFLVVGVLGAFTTFSAFSMDVLGLAAHGRVAMAAVYAGATVVLCIGAAVLGHRLAGIWS